MESTSPWQGAAGARRRRRLAAFAVGLALVWVTVAMLAAAAEVDLAIALLVVLAEVLLVATLAGPWLGVLAALAAVVLVNWYLVPPYRTFEVASADNVAALVVFTLVAVVASWLVEVGARARGEAAASRRQADSLAAIVAPEPAGPLDPLREALALDHVVLLHRGEVVQQVGATHLPDVAPVVDLAVADGYRVVGHGQPRLAADPAFLAALADAAVRAYESGRMEHERARAEQLAAVDRARTALLAGVGHDLRTPLAGLRVAVDALRAPDAMLSDDDRAELLATVADSTSRLDELISNLLDLSRLEAGALITRPERCDVGEVVVRAVLAAGDDGRVDLDVDDALPEVVTDAVLLERVVANLVSNALRHTPATTRVDVRAHADGEGVGVTVADHGAGIPAAERAAVLVAFHQLPGADDAGSGLGLAVVAGFASAMGLEVALDDTDGGGLTVRVHVPAVAP